MSVPIFASLSDIHGRKPFFLLGAAFCYQYVLGPGFTWLATQGGSQLQLLPLADRWITGVLLFMFAFGVGFQTPVVVFVLVYTEIVPDCSKATLQAVIRGKVEPESVIYSDNWRGYNGLVDVGYGKHLRVDHGRNEFAKGKTHINGIEGFWGFAKARLARFRGMRKATFYLHLKECEFRFNSRGDNLYRTILKIVREKPLF